MLWRHYFRVHLIHSMEMDNFVNDRTLDIERVLQLGENEETQLVQNPQIINKKVIAYHLIRVFQGLKQDYCYVSWGVDLLESKDAIVNTYLTKIQQDFGIEMGS